MKILVTGGCGYIGSILVQQLLHAGHLVTVLDNFMYNQTPLLDKCYSSNLSIENYSICNHSIRLKEIYQKFDMIIPLACLTGAPICRHKYSEAVWVIVDSLKFMLDNIDKDVKIIYPNTNSGYGIGGETYCDERSALNPLTEYGRLKCQAEDLILKRGNAIVFRLATVFGLSPRMRLDLLVNDFVYRAVNDKFIVLFEKNSRRNFVHVQDVARAFVHGINNWDKMRNIIYNLGNTEANMSKLDLCSRIKLELPNFIVMCNDYAKDPDKRDYIVSNERLEKTGWKPVFSLDDGIRELIKGYKILKRNQYANF